MITRRALIKGAGALVAGVGALGGYAFAIEPNRLRVARYRLKPAGWSAGLKLRIAALADLHACEPWMDVGRIEQIVEETNALQADVVLLLGDYVAGRGVQRWGRAVPLQDWARALGRLGAPLGVHSVLGNHDWWEDIEVQRRGAGPTGAGIALEQAGIPVYENDARRLVKDGHPFWLTGLGDQWAFWGGRRRPGSRQGRSYRGVDDMGAMLAKVTDEAPVITMLHEPDAFATMPDRISLALAGHTHGGQITLAGFAPVVPSRYGRRYVYGHVREGRRDLVVSAGLGCSGAPFRLGRPPEIMLVEVG